MINRHMIRRAWVARCLLATATIPALLAMGCSEAPGTSGTTIGESNAAVSSVARNGRWIAYATGPSTHTGWPSGSDVFVTRAGHRPQLVASRGSGIWNVCPTFSPDGSMLAFLVVSDRSSLIAVIRVGRDGPIRGSRIDLRLAGEWRACPRWSSDSSRVAYLDERGRVVVRDLDGSARTWTSGDPKHQDFVQQTRGVQSPTGRLIATLSESESGIVISHPDGSGKRVIHTPSYAIGGWSPDGRTLLVLSDVRGGFMMRAVAVEAPFEGRTVVAYVKVNGEVSWPGYGDVSWQPAP
jgi:Tol biopolymer transport system component